MMSSADMKCPHGYVHEGRWQCTVCTRVAAAAAESIIDCYPGEMDLDRAMDIIALAIVKACNAKKE